MSDADTRTIEFPATPMSGWAMLAALVCFTLASFFLIFIGIGVLGLILCFVMLFGFFSLQPNEARVLVLFGKYHGTVRNSGFYWANPFYSRVRSLNVGSAESSYQNRAPIGYKVSLRARTFNMHTLKVNDKRGNPIEIAAVVVWHVQDTTQALFDVDDFVQYVTTQSETALRHLASHYAYDNAEDHEITLRSNVDDVSAALCQELQTRVARAGVVIDEARLSHLAYAPEIAQVMLRRQQAEAVISARQKIVHGAVSMVDMALKELSEKQIVSLDENRRSAMVSNLMVVLCSESEVHPVLQTGSV